VEDTWLVERVDPRGPRYPLVVRVDGARFSEWWVEQVAGEGEG
jgi:hypothetical protein